MTCLAKNVSLSLLEYCVPKSSVSTLFENFVNPLKKAHEKGHSVQKS